MATIGGRLTKHQFLKEIIRTSNNNISIFYSLHRPNRRLFHTCVQVGVIRQTVHVPSLKYLDISRRAIRPLHTCVNVCATKRTLPSINPLVDVQAFTKQELFKDKDKIFTPTKEEVAEAEKLFTPKKGHRIKFLQGAYHPEQAPDYTLPEVAFMGRSNVGKSSLIQALFADVKNLEVRISGKPGHTKLLLFFQCGQCFSLVDMPGYGYRQPENFVLSAEGYLSSRKNLRHTFMLVDSNVGLQPMDFVAIEMLEEFATPYVIVMTKADKANKRHLVTSVTDVVNTIKKKTQCCLPQPFLVSSHSGLGLPFLKCFIAYTTNNIEIGNS